MNQSTSEFSPWAHPKSKRWLETLFEKSNLILEIERWVFDENQHLSRDQLRMITVLLVILGHPDLWPEDQVPRLQKLATRMHSLTRQYFDSKKPALTVEEHKRNLIVNAEWEKETEMLRRRGGLSKRTNKIEFPKSWYRFWN